MISNYLSLHLLGLLSYKRIWNNIIFQVLEVLRTSIKSKKVGLGDSRNKMNVIKHLCVCSHSCEYEPDLIFHPKLWGCWHILFGLIFLISRPFDLGPSLKEACLSTPLLRSNLIEWHGLFSCKMSHSSLTYPCVRFRTTAWELVPTFLNNFSKINLLNDFGGRNERKKIQLYIMRQIKISLWNTL